MLAQQTHTTVGKGLKTDTPLKNTVDNHALPYTVNDILLNRLQGGDWFRTENSRVLDGGGKQMSRRSDIH